MPILEAYHIEYFMEGMEDQLLNEILEDDYTS
jgi:hypothetical protein